MIAFDHTTHPDSSHKGKRNKGPLERQKLAKIIILCLPYFVALTRYRDRGRLETLHVNCSGGYSSLLVALCSSTPQM